MRPIVDELPNISLSLHQIAEIHFCMIVRRYELEWNNLFGIQSPIRRLAKIFKLNTNNIFIFYTGGKGILIV